MRKRERIWVRLVKNLVMPLAALGVVLFFAMALNSLEQGQSEKGLIQLEEALRRGCVSCYAAEGIYPPTLEYLQEHYGVQVDGTRYKVFYEAFAENLMPVITVLELH